ncbi:MAG: hypothetical protein IM618_14445 [Cytophagales bacterium]|nr:hypothetical protein [Cytophagales bacterium]
MAKIKTDYFKVTVFESYTKEVFVEATSEQEAKDIVSGMEVDIRPEHYLEDSFDMIDIVKASKAEFNDYQANEKIAPSISRDQFMAFFRSSESLEKLSVADRKEVFSTILLGSSDITKALLDSVISDYCVENLQVTELK